jgi:hypothetical protein
MAHFFLANHDLKLITVFSPKCASQTLGRWFLNAASSDEKLAWNQLTRYIIAPASITDYKDYLKVIFFRDPLRRLVSFYNHWVVQDNELWCFADDERRFPLKHKTFRQFVYVLEHLERHGMKFQHHLRPQLEQVEQVEFDKVILIEDLDRGLDELARMLKIEVAYTPQNIRHYSEHLREPVADRLPDRLRASGMPRAQWYYDAAVRDVAIKVYALDAGYYQAISGSLIRGFYDR